MTTFDLAKDEEIFLSGVARALLTGSFRFIHGLLIFSSLHYIEHLNRYSDGLEGQDSILGRGKMRVPCI